MTFFFPSITKSVKKFKCEEENKIDVELDLEIRF